MLLDLLELASNKTLEHDPQSRARLQKLQGKTMTLNIKGIGQSLSVTPQLEGLEFSHELPNKADVTLTVSLGAMVKISRDGLDDAELETGELEILGDPIVGQRYAQLMAELDVDWQGLLTEHLGESPAKAITFAASQAKSLVGESRSKVSAFVRSVVKDDLELVADRADIENFLDDVDSMRADADRLMARLTRIQNKL